MKKTAYLSGFIAFMLLAAGIPVANAQTIVYPNSVYSCVSLTNYQALGSSDAYTGGQVTALQQYLNRAGYLSGISGVFDAGTYGAVVNFQRAYGIAQTGTVGPQTRSAINAQSCNGSSYNGYQNGQYNNGYTNTYPYNNGYTNGYTNGYSNGYYGSPTISSFSTSAAYSGTSVTVYGTNLIASSQSVHFGNSTVAVNSTNNNSLTFTVPSFSAGTYTVYVSNNYGSSNSLTFTITGNNSNNCYYTNGYNNSCNNCNPVVYGNNYNYNSNTNYSNNNCGSNYNNGSNNGGTWYGGGALPSISSISGQTSASTGTSYTYTVNAYSQNGLPVTVRADWGDNTTSSNTSSYNSNQQFSFQHTYYTSGTYTVRFTATDSSGAYSYSTQQVSVYGNTYYRNY